MGEYKPSPESSVLSLNKKAMEKLKQNCNKEAFEYLNEAEKLIKFHDLGNQMWAITMNNYGCYYKKVGRLQEALSCLNLALSKEKSTPNDSLNKAATHLNISSIYSGLSVHESALQHGQKALKLLKSCSDRSLNALTTLIVAYHSVGLELEALYRQLEAMKMYKEGWDLAKDTLNESHPVSMSLKRSLNSIIKRDNSSIPTRISRITDRKAKSSNKKVFYNKNPSLSPGQIEKFPYIDSHIRYNSSSYSENYNKIKLRMLKTADKNFPRQFFQLKDTKPEHKKRVLSFFNKKKASKSINQKNLDNLQDLIEEIEGSFSQNVKKDAEMGKGRIRNNESQASSIGVQVELAVEPEGKPEINHLKRSWRHVRKVNKPVEMESDVKLAQLKVKEALKEVEDLKAQQKFNEKKELVPVPNRSKVEFFKNNKLQTIYESKYEDQREAFVLIQSFVRMWIARKQYLRQREAALTIQKFIRGYITRQLYKNISNAVIFIQSYFRGHRVRKLYNFLLTN